LGSQIGEAANKIAIDSILAAIAPNKVKLFLAQRFLVEEQREDATCALDLLLMNVSSVEVQVDNVGLLECLEERGQHLH